MKNIVKFKEIHGHEVMKMMMEAHKPFTRLELEDAIIDKFGPDARFHTCSAAGMDAKGLIDFFELRGKFIQMGRRIMINGEHMCNH